MSARRGADSGTLVAMASVAERLELAGHIQGLWYPCRGGAWLKAVPVAAMLPAVSPMAVVQTFLDDDLYNHLPEDSAYGTLTDCAWRPVDRAEMLRCVDEILAGAAAWIAEVRAEEAAERAVAEAGGWFDPSRKPWFDDDMIDLEALRRWFTDELWAADGPSWFTNMGPDFADEPAVIGVDGVLLAILWLA